MDEQSISKIIVNAAIRVHSALGPGLLESAYERCLEFELVKAGLRVERQLPLPLVYEGMHLECGYRLDLLVDGKVVIEVKAVEKVIDVHVAQILTYLRLSGFHLGFILNFYVRHMKDGIRRFVR